MPQMLEAIFGNLTAERVLLFLHAYDEGYARQIADTFGYHGVLCKSNCTVSRVAACLSADRWGARGCSLGIRAIRSRRNCANCWRAQWSTCRIVR